MNGHEPGPQTDYPNSKKIYNPKMNGLQYGRSISIRIVYSPRKEKACLNKADGYIHKQNTNEIMLGLH